MAAAQLPNGAEKEQMMGWKANKTGNISTEASETDLVKQNIHFLYFGVWEEVYFGWRSVWTDLSRVGIWKEQPEATQH